MLEWGINILSGSLLLIGGAFGFIGGLGLFRFPDFYTRLHGAGITDTLCAICIGAGLILQSGISLLTLKLLLILLFLLFTAPTATHALSRAAMIDGVEPELADDSEPLSAHRGKPSSRT
ncbi:monovalent cation/H(+) antiporter subunit G [Wenzhouxiangella limi]|uniref:Monovalent cation/H(+) antiporter subunit G n=1 Tax=Wenzhouxiangella limi TaxID=2707351 RepID=A0A845UX10_9GAMM|nr:monovalent cation/H(+) antiporter subunit G [Wenzhouxiangella limi]NDY95957.1 monovalent cation/H(+) antiporter subunit G [Wenzhouxiangella limi]